MTASRESDMSRRGFLIGGAASAGALAGLPLLPHEISAADPPAQGLSPGNTDLTKNSAALQADTIVDSACQFCNSLCRLKVHLKNNRIIDVRGETADPVQGGELCVKGPMMTQLVYNRFRLTKPLKRVGGAKG